MTTGQADKRQRIERATQQLKVSKRSLLPIEPLVSAYRKVDSLEILVQLILNNYDRTLSQIDVDFTQSQLNNESQLLKFKQNLVAEYNKYSVRFQNSVFQFVQGTVRSPYVVTSDFATLYEYVKTSPVMNAAGLRTGGYTARMGIGPQVN